MQPIQVMPLHRHCLEILPIFQYLLMWNLVPQSVLSSCVSREILNLFGLANILALLIVLHRSPIV